MSSFVPCFLGESPSVMFELDCCAVGSKGSILYSDMGGCNAVVNVFLLVLSGIKWAVTAGVPQVTTASKRQSSIPFPVLKKSLNLCTSNPTLCDAVTDHIVARKPTNVQI